MFAGVYLFTSVCGSYDSVYLMGDFNAQTGTLEDFTSPDDFLSNILNFDESTTEFYDQKCALERLGVQLRCFLNRYILLLLSFEQATIDSHVRWDGIMIQK